MVFTVLVSSVNSRVLEGKRWYADNLITTIDSPESAKRELNLVFEGFEVDAWLEYEQDRQRIKKENISIS